MLSAEIGLAQPPVVVPELLERDRQLGPGWIERLGENALREGVFDASGTLTLTFRWLETADRADNAPERSSQSRRLSWSDVTWIRLRPLSSLLSRVAELHSQMSGESADQIVVYGALAGPMGPEAEAFGLLGTAACSGAEWLERFQAAGVQIRA